MFGRRQVLGGIAALPMMRAGRGWAAEAALVPLPDAVARGALIYDVTGHGYVAEEFLLRGFAPVYEAVTMADAADMSKRDPVADMGRRDFGRVVRAASVPYTTRVVVYRPADPRHFSGRVILEPAHPVGGGMLSVFGFMNDVFLANGDAHVSVNPPVNFPNLRADDPARYGPLAAADPTQLWGMLRDTGMAVKQGTSLLPAGFAVRTMLMTGYSWTGVAAATFANFHHAGARLADGAPMIDGYLPMANATYVRDLDVPVMRINTQSDFDTNGGLANRKPDSDAPSSRFRLYEVGGASHVRAEPHWPGMLARPPALRNFVRPVGLPTGEEACSVGFPARWKPNDFPLHHYVAAAFDRLDGWIRRGEAPPAGQWIAVDAAGGSRKDRFGNALGGLRSAELTVPTARYGVGPKPGICSLHGYQVEFSAAELARLYGSPVRYRAGVAEAVAGLVAERRLRPREAAMITAQAETRW